MNQGKVLEGRIQTIYAALCQTDEADNYRKFVGRDMLLSFLVRNTRLDMGALDHEDSPAQGSKGKVVVTNQVVHDHARHEIIKLLGPRAALEESAAFNYHEFETSLLHAMETEGQRPVRLLEGLRDQPHWYEVSLEEQAGRWFDVMQLGAKGSH